ncbi:putative U box domain, Zinc finger, RING/FYVE/PHD-type [Helianthus anomalus]
MLQSDFSSTSTIYNDTSPVGTLCYIEPEYQRTGLVSPKSDVSRISSIQDVMVDPCVAADSYTYDRRVIEQWFEEGDSSTMTNL